MKFIVFVNSNLEKGRPIYSRIKSFSKYFVSKGFLVDCSIKKALLGGANYLLISMPPFRKFWLFFIPGLNIVLDIRDGWSIAQETGYGDIKRKKTFKAKMSRLIEKFAIRRSFLAITCTPGLQQYLSRVSGRELILIPNGINDDDLDLINQVKSHKKKYKDSDQVVFCCAGQFSEYGQDKVKKLLRIIASRYQYKKLVILLIGSNEDSNSWVEEFFSQLTSGNGEVKIIPRMHKKELYITMLSADYGLSIVRNPDYELGTKVYDYIALGLPIVNYFDEPNNFTNYFDACLDVSFNKCAKTPEIRRSILIKSVLDGFFDKDYQ
jgi:flavodoxin|tara:strand:- start:61 stop:1026 length:966 start_codon:yes stop_codon:yes gene_type:complete